MRPFMTGGAKIVDRLQAMETSASLRTFCAFPMTHHVECVALLEPAPPG